MDVIITLEGDALEILQSMAGSADTYRIRVAVDAGTIKLKRNESMWTAPTRDGSVTVRETSSVGPRP